MPPTKSYKAAIAFAVSFAVALLATIQGRTDLDTMRVTDWAIVVLGAVVTAGAVHQTTNPPKSE